MENLLIDYVQNYGLFAILAPFWAYGLASITTFVVVAYSFGWINSVDKTLVARKFGIRMIPTQKYLDKNGNVVDTHMGVIEQDELEEKLKKLKVL